MPIFGPKPLYYGPKKSIGCPFFSISHEKITALMPILCQQNFHSKKTPCSHVHILPKKHRFSKKDSAFISFFQICHEKPPAVIPIFDQKYCQFCQNYTILWAKMVNRMALISYFLRKNHRFHVHIL